MKVTNPTDRAIIAVIVPQGTILDGDATRTYEIPAGESIDVDGYEDASTLIEHGATADQADVQAARQLWAEANRAANSRTASASASEGEILARRQATVDVATGGVDRAGAEGALAGAALSAAVKLANESGANIASSLSAEAKREALAAWQASQGSSTAPAGEYVLDDAGDLVLDDDGEPYRVADVQLDEDGDPVLDDDGRPTRVAV